MDPLEVLVESNRTRLQDLVPLRYTRMAASPFAFLRGSALVMATDLATTPTTGLDVMLCGDAHIANFGIFASPERRVVFDLNDFDEACHGSFEWDVKRYAASITVAGRERGLDAAATTALVVEAMREYRDWMVRYSEMSRLDLFYARLDMDELLGSLDTDMRRRTEGIVHKATAKNHMKALSKLTTQVDGKWRIVDDLPLVMRGDNAEIRSRLEAALADYHDSLESDRQALFEQYRFADFARKVVGVGSVGTRCYMVLLQGPNGYPLFLQFKEARQASPHAALGLPGAAHEGRRVVEGQRALQAVSDILLGWGTDPVEGTHYFMRQLWDAKGSFDVSLMRNAGFRAYLRACSWALARAHANSGDPSVISAYLGTSDRFGEAIAAFAEGYADQTERDHAALVRALADGRLPSIPDPAIAPR
jgi:uncharacterized protein (DUF2252 family)